MRHWHALNAVRSSARFVRLASSCSSTAGPVPWAARTMARAVEKGGIAAAHNASISASATHGLTGLTATAPCARCPYCHKIVLQLEEKQIPYVVEKINMRYCPGYCPAALPRVTAAVVRLL